MATGTISGMTLIRTRAVSLRESAGFRNWIEARDDSAFTPEAGRYHLYVSLACPWAHRALILRRLKGLEKVIGLSIVDPYMGEYGWQFSDVEGAIPDTLYGFDYLHQLYQKAAPDYTGRVTTPTLWDTAHETIVSNESADIVRMFNSAFDSVAGHPDRDYYPEGLRAEIDAVNERVYRDVNNGVYKAGLRHHAGRPTRKHSHAVFDTLDWLDERLGGQRYLAGAQLTEADWRLFVTLVRFDAVYYGHFKCNRAAHRGLPSSGGLPARAVSVSGRRGHREHEPYQAALLPQPSEHQSDRYRAGRPDRSILRPRTTAIIWWPRTQPRRGRGSRQGSVLPHSAAGGWRASSADWCAGLIFRRLRGRGRSNQNDMPRSGVGTRPGGAGSPSLLMWRRSSRHVDA